MKRHLTILLNVPVILFLITGCTAMSPTYINEGESAEANSKKTAFNPVHFKLEDSFKTSPPKCIAIMPLIDVMDSEPVKTKQVVTNPISNTTRTAELAQNSQTSMELNDEILAQMRWNLYSHLAPHSYRDVELAKVDKVIEDLGSDRSNYPVIASALKCDALLMGEVIDYSSDHLGFYSQASIGVRMTLIRAQNNEVLWEGMHVAKSQAGSVPLTPIDIVVGIYSAFENVSDEQLVHVEDDLFRRLLSTWDAIDSPLDASEHIQLAEQAPAPEQNEGVQDENHTYSIVVKNLYLRSGPGTQFTAQTVLDEQDKLEIVDHDHSPWLQVKVADGQLGYVNKKYIKAIKALPNYERLARIFLTE